MRSFAASTNTGSDSSDEERPYGLGTVGLHRLALIGATAGLLLVGSALFLALPGGGGDASTRPAAVKRLGAKTTLNTNEDPFSEEEWGPQVAAGPGGVPLGSALTEAYNQTHMQDVDQQQQQPKDNLNALPANIKPGQKCADYEEDHAGLCYTKCSILAGPEYPHRGTPWTCCKDSPCKWNAFKHGFGFIACSGYAVAGTQGKSCPHRHGACMSNEEMFMNECFKTCKELTNNEYPFRKAAASCCKTSSTVSCMNPLNDKTSPSFNVGGGKGDGDPSTPAGPHSPKMIP